MAQEIVLAGGKRTPFGDFGKSLKDIPLTALATHAAKACVEDAEILPEDIDHLVWGNVLPVDPDGYYTGRAAALNIGMKEESCAMQVNRACGSGTQAILTAAQQIMTGHGKIALAGGGENFSRAPFANQKMRWGAIRGAQSFEDTMESVYSDPFGHGLMGATAENLSEDFQYRREDMDAWGLMSQQRAGKAIATGFLARQIAPIEVPEGRKGTRLMSEDEFPRPEITLEKLATLKPVFRKGGQVTPGNSSGVTDGAAFVLVGDRAALEAKGIEPVARIVDWTIVGVSPRIMGCGPVPAIRALWEKRGMKASDIDYYEINEAFAVVNLHAEKELGIGRDVTNIYGGGISIGHPPGATGVRMTITAMHHLQESGQRYACISMCMGAGQGMAVLIENLAV
ncbi:thiolase family protein [uncultured Nisaea sp.]|jgi:acetyl-CoA C-acetyltransferase|uniref:thiolase family protein n=1 Tax=uncultured Nisaea sp. TaxID=538215 RepID=UPI0030ED34D6|tara:strand:+ start:5476 stop:6666 length:1191 start_codon:yes stop_codon:yes gene_type:complete